MGYTVIGRDEDLPELLIAHPGSELFIAIGDNWLRQKVYGKMISLVPHASFATAVHPSAQIGKNVQVGQGTAIMAGTVINSDSRIGTFTIINTGANLDHDCHVHDFTSLAPGATTGGNVTLGEYSVISIGATILHGITIGKHSIIGAGALLTKDCEDNVIMYGVPAKKIRAREPGEKYL
jgi:sugar O-acyltransferase (sialic acid O-acetyltransferase NeuD family)